MKDSQFRAIMRGRAQCALDALRSFERDVSDGKYNDAPIWYIEARHDELKQVYNTRLCAYASTAPYAGRQMSFEDFIKAAGDD